MKVRPLFSLLVSITVFSAFAVSGYAEKITHSFIGVGKANKTGLVAEEESPKALADAITASLNRPKDYANWRPAARDRAREFHWDHVLPAACDQLEAWAKG